ncbi:Hyaluronan and proteoglycan link protein 1 [Allomyces arbusculus]|nr:Hyaluronan and proteoglycan link protein 1 [Allomyces arbusculus]
MSAANLGQSAPSGPEKLMGGPPGPTKSPLDDLAALRRVLMAEEDSRPSVTGILSVKIKQVHFLELNEAQLIHSKCFATMSIRTLTKKTHVTRKENGVLHWNQTKHFPVVVPRSRKHPFNLLRIQILEVSSTDPTRTFPIGSVSFHVHDILGVSPIAGVFDLWDQHRLVGDVSLEITFNYGSFGYGYSPQLKEEKRVPEDMITYSLFPRINPPEDQMESVDGVMAVKAVPHPSYIPFTEKVYLSYGKELGDLKGMSDKQYVPDFVARDLSHLKAIRDQYVAMTDRVARILFLHKHLTSSNLRPETVLDANDAAPPAPRVDPNFVQPFSLAPMVKDEIVFQALAKHREARRSGNGPPAGSAAAGMPSSSSRGSTSGLMQGGSKRRSVNFQPGAIVERRKKWVDDMITFEQPEDALEEGEDA